MKNKILTGLLTGLFMLGMVAMVNAASFTFDGNIAYHNDVIEIGFTLDTAATDVSVWTDSFMNQTNFDPITAVWEWNGSDYTLIGQNDDNDSIAPGQTWFDSGLTFASLDAGDYLFTIATYANFASGTYLSDGFAYGLDTPIPMADWVQPANYLDMGTYYRVNLDGVDSATDNDDDPAPVPEPSTVLLLGSGLVGLAWYGRKRKKG